jgi:hypothetical protein
MKTAMGSMVSLSIAFIVVASALIPLVSSGALASSQSYVIRPPADFTLDNQYNYANGSTGLDIYYDPTKLNNDGDVKIYADKAFGTVTSFYGQYNYRITLILAADHDQYVALLNPDPTETQNISADEVASNYGYGVNGTIVIEVPGLVPDFGAILTQQISDIVLRTELIGNKYNVPDWFSLGLSNYLSGNITNSSQNSINALASQGKLMTIDQMESILENSNDPNDLSIAEAQASILMEYIGTSYGNSTITNVLTNFGPTGNMDKAFQSVTGRTPDEINTQWQESLNISLNNLKSLAIAQRIDGYVLDPDGKPVSNLSIYFIPASGGQALSATTDSSGFYLLNLSSGTYTAHLFGSSYATINDVVTLSNSQVLEYNFTFADPTPVPSTVLPASGSSADNGTIYIVLAAINAIALVLIAFVFWRTRK